MTSRPALQLPAGQSASREQPRSLSANVRWTLLGTAANSAGTWLVIVILARASGPAAVGAFAFALALTTPVMWFVGLQLGSLLASDREGGFRFREYTRVTWIANAIGVVSCGAIAFVTGTGEGGWPVIAAVCVFRAAESLASVYFGLWQKHERMQVIGAGRVLQAVVSIGVVAVACHLGGGARGAAAGTAVGSVALVAFLHLVTTRDPALAGELGPAPADWPRRMMRLAAQGIPLGAILLLGALQINIPRYFIDRYGGAVELGFFAAASQLTMAGNVVVNALGSAALSRLAVGRTGRDASFLALTAKLAVAGAALGLAGIALSALAGRQILVALYRPQFAAADRMLLVLSIAAGFGFVASLLGYALTAARVIAVQPVLLGLALTALVVVSVAVGPRHGAVGVAWAVVVAAAVQTIGSAGVLYRLRVRTRALARSLTP